MLNRRKFIGKSFLAAVGSFLFPKLILAEEAESVLDFKPNPDEWSNDQVNLAWIGHSTILLNFYGTIILTDPILLNRIGMNVLGLSFGPSRLTPPALAIDEIPKPDIILLSHAHFDHTDYNSLKKLTKKYPNKIDVIAAYLTKDVIEDLEWKSITIIDWNESTEINNIKFTALEVEHFGWRVPWEKDRSRGYMKDGRSYNAYLIENNGTKILFGGDTRKTKKLEVLKDTNPDVAIMPIGAYNPWTHAHCNPEEALVMAENIGAKYFIPIHTKTFKLGSEPFEEPIDWLKKSVENYNIKLGIDSIGQTFTLS
ncbi:MAG: MBL fold metallo-hydrolase [Ignavibacteriales bacterium]|nr:MBL fold metallo-hydrolase [Ignavibacteriales bacterium]